MTQLDVLYRYGAPPTERAVLALCKVRDVYGVRHLAIDEAARTVRVEYDATRLTAAAVTRLVLQAGLEIAAELPMIPPQPPEQPAPEPAPAS